MGDRRVVRRALVALVAVGSVMASAACGGGDDGDAGSAADDPTTTAAAAAQVTTTTGADGGVRSSEGVLRVLVTNDDGVGAAGIDALVEALRQLPDVQITVVAPAENQSGTGGKSSEAPPAATPAATASGFEAIAVAGFPVDAVVHALDGGGMKERPHLVLSGINDGANLGPVVEISGTVGAARAAAARGIPALASSQGHAEEPDEPDFASGVEFVLDWVAEHRDALVAGEMAPGVESLNIPSCTVGEIRGLVEVPNAADAGGRDLAASNCESTSPTPVDDVDAFGNGFVSLSVLAA